MAWPSILTRAARRPDLMVAYGRQPDHVADVWLPVGSGPVPLVLFLHGGFWRAQFDRTHTGPLAAALAARGYAVALLEFRRIGQDAGGWPETFDDVALATDMLPALIADKVPGRIDRDRVMLAGHSAGGHLAMWAAARHCLPTGARWWLPGARPWRGVLALAPVCDLAVAHRLGLGGQAVAALLRGGPEDVPDRYAATDTAGLLPTGVPTAMLHGTLDQQVPVSLTRRYVAAARDAGERITFTELPNADHFAVIDPESTAWPSVVHAVDGLGKRRP